MSCKRLSQCISMIVLRSRWLLDKFSPYPSFKIYLCHPLLEEYYIFELLWNAKVLDSEKFFCWLANQGQVSNYKFWLERLNDQRISITNKVLISELDPVISIRKIFVHCRHHAVIKIFCSVGESFQNTLLIGNFKS